MLQCFKTLKFILSKYYLFCEQFPFNKNILLIENFLLLTPHRPLNIQIIITVIIKVPSTHPLFTCVV